MNWQFNPLHRVGSTIEYYNGSLKGAIKRARQLGVSRDAAIEGWAQGIYILVKPDYQGVPCIPVVRKVAAFDGLLSGI